MWFSHWALSCPNFKLTLHGGGGWFISIAQINNKAIHGAKTSKAPSNGSHCLQNISVRFIMMNVPKLGWTLDLFTGPARVSDVFLLTYAALYSSLSPNAECQRDLSLEEKSCMITPVSRECRALSGRRRAFTVLSRSASWEFNWNFRRPRWLSKIIQTVTENTVRRRFRAENQNSLTERWDVHCRSLIGAVLKLWHQLYLWTVAAALHSVTVTSPAIRWCDKDDIWEGQRESRGYIHSSVEVSYFSHFWLI